MYDPLGIDTPYDPLGLNKPTLMGRIQKFAADNYGDTVPGIEMSATPEEATGLIQGAASLGTGLASWIPAGLSMTPVTIEGKQGKGEQVTLRAPSEMARTANEIQGALTYEPPSEEGRRIAELGAAPLAYLAEKGNESKATWNRWADEERKKGNEKTAKAYEAAALVAGAGGEALPFLIPAAGKPIVRGAKAVAKGVKAVSDRPFRSLQDVLEAVDQPAVRYDPLNIMKTEAAPAYDPLALETPNAPPVDEATRLRAQFDAEQTAQRNAAPVVQAETLPIETGKKASAPQEIVQSGANLKAAEIRDSFMQGKTPATENGERQQLFLTGGPAGAGKSTALSVADKSKFVEVNSDSIKPYLGKDAAAVHEQSSAIAKDLLQTSLDGGYHTIYDSQLTNFPLADNAIQKVLGNGGTVDIFFTNIDAETSIARTASRAEAREELRTVPIDVSIKGHNASLPTFLELYKKYKGNPDVNFALFDNNADFQKPILVFEQKNGKVIVHDKIMLDNLTNTPYNIVKKGGEARYERSEKASPESIATAAAQIDLRRNALRNAKSVRELPGSKPSQEVANTSPSFWPNSDEAKFSFSEMKSQLEAGAPRGVNEIDGETFAWGSSYPQWFRDVSAKHNLSAKETTSFINKYLLQTEPVPRTFKGTLTDRQGAIYDDIIKAAKKEAEPYAGIQAEIDAIGKEGQGRAQEVSLSEIAEEESLSKAELDAAAKDVEDFFSSLAPKPTAKDYIGKTETGNVAGIPNDLNLVNPETEIFSGDVSKKNMTPTTTLFSGIDPSRIKEVGQSLYNAVKNPPQWTTFKEALGKFGGAVQMGNLEMQRYATTLKKRVPDKITREAIVNYLQADGDVAILSDRFKKSAANPKTKHLATGYDRAAKLSDNEKAIAAEVKQHYEDRLKEAIDVDMLDAGIENYVNQVWDKENPVTAKLKGQISTGKLQPNPALIRQRIFDSYFEGEQAGYKPKNKDVGFLLTSYDQAFNKAIASRAFIKSLNEKLATDGRPLAHPSGMGMPIPKEGVTEAILIKPRLKPEEFGDYQPLDHPALRKWKWVSKAEDGTPIYLQGDLLVHPEIYKHLKNVLSTSVLRQNPIGKAALTVVQSLKGTLLSLSGFHQTHISQHALTHRTSPINAAEIDLKNPLDRSLIEHGLSVADHASMDLFSEGMASSGLINKVPGIGPLMQKYTEYLFKGFIPRVKMAMAKKAYEANSKRYGKELSDDQIQFLTTQQANAAFGELNYDMMGRNKTLQDVLRLVLLAPDFLEARGRFVAQAVTPYGKEQFMAAAVRGALGMYTGARVINAVFNDGDPKWDKMFNVVIGGREYSIRSVQGDVQHLFTDPRSFVYYRMNPTTVRTMIEYLTSRDALGRYRDTTDQVGDFIKAHIPMPVQGAMKSSDNKIWQSMLNSTGVTSYESRTAFDKAVMDEKGKKFVATPLKSERDRIKLVSEYGRDYKEAIKNQDPVTEIAARLQKDLDAGNIYEEDLEKIHSMATVPRTLHNLKSLSVEDVMPIWDKATTEEKQQYQEVFVKKIENLSENHPERYRKLLPELRKLFNKEPERAQTPVY